MADGQMMGDRVIGQVSFSQDMLQDAFARVLASVAKSLVKNTAGLQLMPFLSSDQTPYAYQVLSCGGVDLGDTGELFVPSTGFRVELLARNPSRALVLAAVAKRMPADIALHNAAGEAMTPEALAHGLTNNRAILSRASFGPQVPLAATGTLGTWFF